MIGLVPLLEALSAHRGQRVIVEIGRYVEGQDAPNRQYARLVGPLGPWRAVDVDFEPDRGVVYVPVSDQHQGDTGFWIEGDDVVRGTDPRGHFPGFKLYFNDEHYLTVQF